MAQTNNPMSPEWATSPAVSKTTMPIAGLKVDIYGLAELPETATSLSCLWLHHPRLRNKDDMACVANEALAAFYSSSGSKTSTRGLIAVAFDQRNHGSRLISETANEAWRQGNPTHAQDMFGTVSGMVADTIHLLDVLEGYLFEKLRGRHIDSNLVLGVSLGGHSAWQLLFAEPRVTAGAIVIGCPDYMNLMQDRARLSKLSTFTADNGASFLGSKDFPTGLIGACKKYDPKGILFGTGETLSQPPVSEQARLRVILDSRVRGKRFQVLSGGADKLVPYNAGRQFLEFLKNATGGWYKDGNVYLEDNIYPEVGHEFNAEMCRDAIRFILETVKPFDSVASSKI
ncbi:hypothetical protein GGR50DRAFT_635165 [Xylaria sp. CBS 124048]|nr:hypothetical protein GGR50DRAFT_635165 [Xylaria sp. CBS 124048]